MLDSKPVEAVTSSGPWCSRSLNVPFGPIDASPFGVASPVRRRLEGSRMFKGNSVRSVGSLIVIGAGVCLAACGSSPTAATNPTSTVPRVVTLGSVVSALRGSSLPICNVTNDPGGAPGISADSEIDVSLTNDGSCNPSSTYIVVYGYADSNAAYVGAGDGTGPAVDTWTVGNISVTANNLGPSDEGAYDGAMQSLGAAKYPE